MVGILIAANVLRGELRLFVDPRSILEASFRRKIFVVCFDASLSQILVLTAAVCTCIVARSFILVLIGLLRLRNVSKTMGNS